MQNDPHKRQELREIPFWVLWVVGSSIGAWFLPNQYHLQVVFGILGLSILFDILSLFYHVMTILTGKFMSGFPGVSLLFYLWFLLASKFSLVAMQETALLRIVIYKLVDAVILIAFSFLCHLPTRFQGPRDRYN